MARKTAAQTTAAAVLGRSGAEVQTKPAARSGEKITVACNLPNGLILQLYKMVEFRENVMGGGSRISSIAQKMGEPVRLNGTAVPFGKIPRFPIEGAFALTPNVDKDFFDEWMRQNAELELVKRGGIYSASTTERARDLALELTGEPEARSGLEPMLPDKDPRAGKSINPNLTQIEAGSVDAAA